MDAYAQYIASMASTRLIAERENITRCIEVAGRCGTTIDLWRLGQKRGMVNERIGELMQGEAPDNSENR